MGVESDKQTYDSQQVCPELTQINMNGCLNYAYT